MAPIAVVDIGTNSTRLLVARVEDGRVEELERQSKVTRLGQDVDSTGRLAGEAVERVFRVLGDYNELIDENGAQRVVALATSAVRDSENGEEFRAAVHDRFGFDLRTISGDEEARLTFLGATSARRERDASTLVIDIGGGSTELVTGRPGDYPDFHVSTQAGSVRQTERHLHDDPPTPEQTAALRREMHGIVEESVPAPVRESVTRGIAVAGTATQLAAIDLGLAERDRGRVHGHVMELESVQRMLDRLASVPLRSDAAREGSIRTARRPSSPAPPSSWRPWNRSDWAPWRRARRIFCTVRLYPLRVPRMVRVDSP